MKRRSTDDHDQISEAEVKQARATPFQWATLALTNLPMIVKIIMLLGIGGATAVTAPKVYQSLNGEVDVPAGEVAEVQPGQTDYSIAIRAINKKLLEHDEELKAINARRIGGDKALEERVTELETHH